MILFEKIPLDDLFSAFAVYGLWLTFVLTITIFFNVFFKSPGVVGFASLATVIVLSLFSGALSHWLDWSPTQLASYTSTLLVSGKMADGAWGAIILSISGIIVLLFLSILVFRKKELA
jgi:ABC-2 type transport system permease protein